MKNYKANQISNTMQDKAPTSDTSNASRELFKRAITEAIELKIREIDDDDKRTISN